MKISICVPVYNESEVIEDFLKSFEKQIDKDFELVIVDNNSSDNTLSIVENYSKKSGYKMKVLTELKQGVGHARATGASYAIENNFDILAGTDCDCDIHPKWVSSIREMFTDESISIASGKYVHSIPSLKKLISELNDKDCDRFVYFFELNNFILQYTLRRSLLTGSNFAIRSKVYLAGNGFQQPYKDGKPAPLEDHELGRRLYDLGYDTVFMKYDCPSNPRRILQWLIDDSGQIEVYGPQLTYIRQEDFAGLLHKVSEDRFKFRIRRVLFYNVLSPISKFEKQVIEDKIEWFFGEKTQEFLEKLKDIKSEIDSSKELRLKFMDDMLDIYFPYIYERITEKFDKRQFLRL